ncbi:MAG TPA: sortase [Patescibacteria group bacterium]|nr:sortase [Patescibacteria group bacterium]
MPPSVVSSVQISANNDILGIPALNISTPIVYSSATNESGIQQDLESGVVHLAGTANPGDVGNAYIVGHSSNFKDAPGSFNEVFKNLPNIRVGDEITIRQGTRQLRFVVTKTQVVEPTELWVMSQATDGAKILTLQTSYPVGTAKQRFVAIAKLEE